MLGIISTASCTPYKHSFTGLHSHPPAFSVGNNLLDFNNLGLISRKVIEFLDCRNLLWVFFTMDSKPKGVM